MTHFEDFKSFNCKCCDKKLISLISVPRSMVHIYWNIDYNCDKGVHTCDVQDNSGGVVTQQVQHLMPQQLPVNMSSTGIIIQNQFGHQAVVILLALLSFLCTFCLAWKIKGLLVQMKLKPLLLSLALQQVAQKVPYIYYTPENVQLHTLNTNGKIYNCIL